MARTFAFTVTVIDDMGRVVTSLNGHSDVHDDQRTTDQISRSIINDLPGHLRKPIHSHNVNLRQLA